MVFEHDAAPCSEVDTHNAVPGASASLRPCAVHAVRTSSWLTKTSVAPSGDTRGSMTDCRGGVGRSCSRRAPSTAFEAAHVGAG